MAMRAGGRKLPRKEKPKRDVATPATHHEPDFGFWPYDPNASVIPSAAIYGRILLYHSEGAELPYTAIVGVAHQQRSINHVIRGRFPTAELAYLEAKEQLETMFSQHAQQWAQDL